MQLSSYICTWEVCQALKKLKSHSAIASCDSYAFYASFYSCTLHAHNFLNRCDKCAHDHSIPTVTFTMSMKIITRSFNMKVGTGVRA